MTAILSVVLLSGLWLEGPLAAIGHWHDDDADARRQIVHREHDDRQRASDCYITPSDVRMLNEYYSLRDRHIPFGLQRKLRRGERMPTGWEDRLEALPVLVDRQLTTLPPGMRRDLLDGNAVIFDSRTGIIVDAVALLAAPASVN